MTDCKDGGIVKSYLFNASDWTWKDGGRLKRKYGKFKRECIVYEIEEKQDEQNEQMRLESIRQECLQGRHEY